jgi:hypothetical protein
MFSSHLSSKTARFVQFFGLEMSFCLCEKPYKQGHKRKRFACYHMSSNDEVINAHYPIPNLKMRMKMI